MGLLAQFFIQWMHGQPLARLVNGITDAVNGAPWFSTWAFLLAVINIYYPHLIVGIFDSGSNYPYRSLKVFTAFTVYSSLWNIGLAYLDIYLPHYFVKPFALRQLLANFTLVIMVIIMLYSFNHTGLIFGIKYKDLPEHYAEFIPETEMNEYSEIDFDDNNENGDFATSDKDREIMKKEEDSFKYTARRPDLNYPKPGDENKALSYIQGDHEFTGDMATTSGIKSDYKLDGSDLPEYYNGKKIKMAASVIGRKKQVIKINHAERERADYIERRERERLNVYESAMTIQGGIIPWLFGTNKSQEAQF